MKKVRKYVICLAMLCLIFALPISSQAANTSIKLNKTKATVYVGKTLQLKATVKGKSKKVIWKSSNRAIATVSSKGKVTAKKSGKVRITAKANGKSRSCIITVKKKTKTGTFKKLQGKYYKWDKAPYHYEAKFSGDTKEVYIGIWHEDVLPSIEDFKFKITDGKYTYRAKGMRSGKTYNISLKPVGNRVKVKINRGRKNIVNATFTFGGKNYYF